MTLRDLMNYAHQMETEYDMDIYDLPMQFYLNLPDRGYFPYIKGWIVADGKHLIFLENEIDSCGLYDLKENYKLFLEEQE